MLFLVSSGCALRGLLGLTEAAGIPAGVKSTTEWFPKKERAFATGIFNAGTGRAQSFNDVAVTMVNACREAAGEGALSLGELRERVAVEKVARFRDELAGEPGVELFGSHSGNEGPVDGVGVVSLRIAGYDPRQMTW